MYLDDKTIISLLKSEYGLIVRDINALALGADPNAITYQVTNDVEDTYFLKLKRSAFDAVTLLIPHLLREQGISQVIAPMVTLNNQLSAQIESYHVILYPFVDGDNGFTQSLTPEQWRNFGQALHTLHTLTIPELVYGQLRQETFRPIACEKVLATLHHLPERIAQGSSLTELLIVMQSYHDDIRYLAEQSLRFAEQLREHSLPMVLCHTDIHAGNVMLDKTGQCYIVDWDEAMLAPKERDLMFIGGGIGGVWHDAKEELFFWEGYGQTDINRVVLAYYRHQRIVEDIAVWIDEFATATDADRATILGYFEGSFAPNSVVAIARKTAENL